MSTKAIWTIVIIVLVVALGLIYWSYSAGPNASYPLSATSTPAGSNPAVNTTNNTYYPPVSNTGNPNTSGGTASSTATSTRAQITFKTGLNQAAGIAGIELMPVTVLEDSRCPVGVYCIQAGTVRLRTQFSLKAANGTTTTGTQDFTLGQAISIGTASDKKFTLTAVSPNRISTETIKPSDYVFTFEVVDTFPKP